MKKRKFAGDFQKYRKVVIVFWAAVGMLLFFHEISVQAASGTNGTVKNQIPVREEGQEAARELDSEELMEIQRQAEEKILDEFDFSQLDTKLKDLFPKERLQFTDVMSSMMSGNLEETGKLLFQYIGDFSMGTGYNVPYHEKYGT